MQFHENDGAVYLLFISAEGICGGPWKYFIPVMGSAERVVSSSVALVVTLVRAQAARIYLSP